MSNPTSDLVDGPASAHDAGIVRRVPRASGKFSGRVQTPPADEQLISRVVLKGKSSAKRQLGTSHIIAGDLPDWEPLPPGELTVLRRGSHE